MGNNHIIVRGIPMYPEKTRVGFLGTPLQVLQQQGYGVSEPLCDPFLVLSQLGQYKYGEKCQPQRRESLDVSRVSRFLDEEGLDCEGSPTFCLLKNLGGDKQS